MCSTREDSNKAASACNEVAAELGLTISVVKTKLLIAGVHLEERRLAPFYIKGQLGVVVQVPECSC